MLGKEIVTILGVLLLWMAQLAMATPVNSNSIIVDDVEYYMQTDKAVYNLGENVEMLYGVTNLRQEDVTFGFPYTPEWNFWVEKDGESIWRAVNGWWTMGTSFTLSPGEYKEFPVFEPPYIWDMRDAEDNLVNIGEYVVIGGFDAMEPELYSYSRVSVGIEIVPEPATLCFLSLGAVLVKRKLNI